MKNNYEIKLVDKSVYLKVLNFLKNNLILSGYILPNIEHYGYKSSLFLNYIIL